MSQEKTIEFTQMAPLREASQKISQFLRQTLAGYLAPLGPLLAPNRILGEFLEGFQRERVHGADQAFAALEERFVKLCRDTFKLPSKLVSPVPAIKSKLEVYPWEYHFALGGDPSKTVTITSPVRWVLAYEHPFTLSNLLKAKQSGEKPQMDDTKQLIINSVTLAMMMDRSPGIKQILGDLRFPVSLVTAPVSGDLPYVVVDSPVQSFRPQQDLMNMVVQLSGRPVFEELVDLDEIKNIQDPLADRIRALVS